MFWVDPAWVPWSQFLSTFLCLSNCWFSSFALFLLHSDFFLSLRLHSVSTPLHCWAKNFKDQKLFSSKKIWEKKYFETQNIFGQNFFSDHKVFWTKKFFRLKIFTDLNFFRPKFFGPTFFSYPKFSQPQLFSNPKCFGSKNFWGSKFF